MGDVAKLRPGSLQTVQFVISIVSSEGASLGLDFDITDETSLLVDSVHDGLVKEWNVAHPDFEVRHRDRFVDVNGVAGNTKAILQELSAAESMAISVRRPVE